MSDQKTPTLVIATHKGGAAKTTTAVNVAAEFGRAGLKVLLIDLDPQANASLHVGKQHPANVPVTMAKLLRGDVALLPDAIHEETTLPNVSLIYASIDLDLVNEDLRNSAPRPSEELKMKLEPVAGLFDVIVIDTPPALNLLTRNGFAAATHVLIPVESGSQYALYGVTDLLTVMNSIKRINPSLKNLGALLVKHDERQTVCRLLSQLAVESFDTVVPIRISQSTKVNQASISKVSISMLDRSNKVAREYTELADYLIDEMGLKRTKSRKKPAPRKSDSKEAEA